MFIKPSLERHADTNDGQRGGCRHVRVANSIVAVEAIVFAEHDACANKHRDAHIVQACNLAVDFEIVDAG